MPSDRLVAAHRLLEQAVGELVAAVSQGAGDDDLLSALTICEGARRRLDQVSVTGVAVVERRGTFAQRGYRNSAAALSDMLGCERAEAHRLLTGAAQVCARIGLDGQALPPKLAATAAVFVAGQTSLRHVEIIAAALGTRGAARLTPSVWAGAEDDLADKATIYPPAQLRSYAAELIEKLDQDGPEPADDPEPALVNELYLTRRRDGDGGGTLKGRFDDAAMYDAIATLLDAHAKPRTAEDQRSAGQRQAEALADVCGHVLAHGDVPESGGHRPHLNVLITLEDLENRALSAMLDFGGRLSPESLRMLACDAKVIPIVMNGKGQPLDVGRASRTAPDGLRRAVAARDHGCIRCGHPPAWSEIHHIMFWEHGGETTLENCAMLCRTCHRLIHRAGWEIRLVDGIPECIPPPWVDILRRPQRRPRPGLVAA